MRVIGTAGHVDHGKSTLVEALTGIHPDRLKEEREREMTIDLGFAWLELAGEEVGVVDVPGHRDFIENMLAGIGGIDAVLFVVAADEGIMPQTREHLAILDILQIPGGVVALTKIDLVDSDWLTLVEEDLRQGLAGTVLGKAPIVRVSARSGAGLKELKTVLADCLAERPPRPDLNRPRLPVDRAFTIAGFGSVVTGTLSDGCLSVGDEIEILPAGMRGRIRGLQTHKHKEQTATPGSRTAVNISGIALEEIRSGALGPRGSVVTHPGNYRPTQRLDVHFRLLPDVSQPLKHNSQVKFFIGAAEVIARLRLLGIEELAPGQEGWLQLELTDPVVAVRGDHYILRRPSPSETLGGGKVIDPHPKTRHKRFSPETLKQLEALAQGVPSDVLLQALLALGIAPLKNIITRSNLEAAPAAEAVAELVANGLLLNLEALQINTASPATDDLVISKGFWDQIAARAINETEHYHRTYPLRSGLPREELKSRLATIFNNKDLRSPRLFNAIMRKLVIAEALKETGPLVMRPGHSIRFTPQQTNNITKLMQRFAASPYSPPSLKECQADAGEDVVAALVETGQLIAVAPDVLFRRQDYESMLADVRRLMQQNGAITVAQVRDHFNTSRRYVLAFLEHLDAQGITTREGDNRRLKK